MTSWPTRTARNVSTQTGHVAFEPRCKAVILVLAVAVLASEPAFATGPRDPPNDPPMPDPCTTAPVLPFCR